MHVFRKEWKLQFYWLPPVNITVQISPTCSDQFKLSLDSAKAGEGITLGILCLVWHKMQCYKHINRITDTISIICSFFERQKAILKLALYTVNFYHLPKGNSLVPDLVADVQRESLEKYTSVKNIICYFLKETPEIKS